MQEIRKALERFRAAGRTAKDGSAKKFIAAYGDELGPDLINTLQSMGADAANTWHHMWVTMQQDNAPELFAQMGQEWTAGLDLADQIATYCAGNLTAYQLATGQMGSTKIEWILSVSSSRRMAFMSVYRPSFSSNPYIFSA